jgi:hypothetical protein
MFKDLKTWKIWASFLQQFGVSKYVAIILDTVGPLNIVGAQIMHIGYPLFKIMIPESHLSAMIELMEDQNKIDRFTEMLREEIIIEQP